MFTSDGSLVVMRRLGNGVSFEGPAKACTLSRTISRRLSVSSSTAGSVASTKEVCGVDCAIGAVPSILRSKTELIIASDGWTGGGLARSLKMLGGV